MSNPYIAGLGQAFAGLGSDLTQQKLLQLQIQKYQNDRARQQQQDEFANALAAQEHGGTVLPQGTDPSQALHDLVQGNDIRSNGALLGPAAAGAGNIAPHQYEFGPPTVQTFGNRSVLFNPDVSPAALAEKRAVTLADMENNRWQQRLDAQQAKQDAEDKARESRDQQRITEQANATTAQAHRKNLADYNALHQTFSTDALGKQPYDENTDYAGELTQQRALQAAREKPVTPNYIVPPNVVDANGQPVALNTHTGQQQPLQGASRVQTGQQNAQVVRERDYLRLVENALPTLQANVNAVDPAKINLALTAHGLTGAAANSALTQQEQDFIGAGRDAIAGMLHQESGSRLSDSQLAWGTKRYLPQAGDTPQTKAAKIARLRQEYTSRLADVNGQNTGGRGGAPNPDQQTGNINLAGGPHPIVSKYGITPP